MELVLLAGVITFATTALYVAGGWLLTRSRSVCPACRAKKLENVDANLYACEACGAEFVREPAGLVPREAWDRGMREPPAVAKVIE
jgi:hypothetical protein